jgi:hypothetical protein
MSVSSSLRIKPCNVSKKDEKINDPNNRSKVLEEEKNPKRSIKIRTILIKSDSILPFRRVTK